MRKKERRDKTLHKGGNTKQCSGDRISVPLLEQKIAASIDIELSQSPEQFIPNTIHKYSRTHVINLNSQNS